MTAPELVGLGLSLGAAWALAGRDALAVLAVCLVVVAFVLGGR